MPLSIIEHPQHEGVALAEDEEYGTFFTVQRLAATEHTPVTLFIDVWEDRVEAIRGHNADQTLIITEPELQKIVRILDGN